MKPASAMKRLSDEDLMEFNLRKQALDQARNQYLMVQEAWQAWLKTIGRKYRVGPRFTVNQQSGIVSSTLTVVENGRSDTQA